MEKIQLCKDCKHLEYLNENRAPFCWKMARPDYVNGRKIVPFYCDGRCYGECDGFEKKEEVAQ